MFVIKRDGRKETTKFDKILRRITRLCKDLKNVDGHVIAQKVILGLFDGVSSRELDRLAIEQAYSMSVQHPDYDKLALKLAISSLHKDTADTFSECIEKLYNAKDPFGNPKSVIAEDIYKVVKKNAHILNAAIDYNRDYNFDYFGFRTLERSYLLKTNEWDAEGNHYKAIAERPQHMWMRVAVGIHLNDIEAAINTYEMLSTFQATHATPTLFNAGTIKNQMSSCFLMSLKDNQDSIPGIYDALKEAALISQSAGGIGIHIHKVRSKGSPIYGTGGASNGIIPMLKNFNETMRYIDQCFTGDTFVYTSEGPKKISQIFVGDEVFGSSGKLNKVKKTFQNAYTGPGVELSLNDKFNTVKVRKEHPLLVLKSFTSNPFFELKGNHSKPEWISAENISVNDWVCYPLNFEEQDLDYTEDDCLMYIFMHLYGSFQLENKFFSLLIDKDENGEFIKRYLTLRGIKYELKPFEHDEKREEIEWSPCSAFKFNTFMFYNTDFKTLNQEYIHKSILNLPKEKCAVIVNAIIKWSKTRYFVDEYHLYHDNTVFCGYDFKDYFLEQVRFLFLKAGILTKKYHSGHGLNLIIESTDRYFIYDNRLYVRVSLVNECVIDETVYDLEVEPDHEYVTEIGIAHNGGGKRKGSAAIYLEPWHADIFEFLDLRKNNGKEELRARDLNLAIWAPDLFFKRVKEDGNWTLMDPNRCKGLSDVYGEAFDKLYTEYEEKKFGERAVKARDLWAKILESCIETGQPYLLAKDACNIKSNQKNLGTICSSNLCSEIVQYSDPEQTSVCNLASISLPACLDGKKNKKFNFEKLEQITATLTENLNKVIDVEYYPVETARNSNLKHRPIGIGVQGLGTLFAQLRLSWDSEEAKQLNKDIFETMYYAALKKSNEIAKKLKSPYSSFPGSPLSEGIFQFELWGLKPSDKYDWEGLRKSIKKYGVRNSLLLCVMPSASTSQILSNSECIEPITSNIYKRSTLSGEFVQVNKYLVQDLMDLGIWSEELRQLIIAHNGSVQNINIIPDDIKKLYKTVWEISQKVLIDMSADRAPFICQSQSLNLYFENANFAKLSSAYMYAWEKGLKTLVYYTRTKAAREAIKFTVDTDIEDKNKKVEEEENIACSLDNPEGCEACGS